MFHLKVQKGQLEALKDGQVLPLEVHSGIYAYITPEDECPNFTHGGRGYLLNFYCPIEGDFKVHTTTKKPTIHLG